MDDLLAILLLALGGLLLGGAISFVKTSKPMTAVLAVCAVLAVTSGVLRLDYF